MADLTEFQKQVLEALGSNTTYYGYINYYINNDTSCGKH